MAPEEKTYLKMHNEFIPRRVTNQLDQQTRGWRRYKKPIVREIQFMFISLPRPEAAYLPVPAELVSSAKKKS